MNAILLIEDDLPLGTALARALRQAGYNATWVRRLVDAQKWITTNTFEAIVLDLGLPDGEGHTFLEELRAAHSDVPVIIASARDALSERLKGLDSGADDYLTKPFSINVLLARIRAVGRRGAVVQPTVLQVGDLCLDPASHSVTKAGDVVNLTPREYQLLELLMRNRGRAVSREAILQSVWGFDHEVSENNLEVFVRQLRIKTDMREPKLIHTVRGFGYIMREP